MYKPEVRNGNDVRLEEVHLMIRKNGVLYRVRLPAARLEAAFAKGDAKRRYVGTYPEPPRVRLVKVEDEGEEVADEQTFTMMSAAALEEGEETPEQGPVCAKMADCSIICWA